jgi:hypothetical protein
MIYGYRPQINQQTQHKVFISYYHRADQWNRDRFEQAFGHLFISKSVQLGGIDSDLSTDYIKCLIQEGYISDSSVVIVLVGQKTYCRKHVDWEISAGLNKKINGYSGLLGILLPDFPLTPNGQYYFKDIPARLADNVKTGYANVYTWNWLCSSHQLIQDAIQEAFQHRVSASDKIDNSRIQMGRNLCD